MDILNTPAFNIAYESLFMESEDNTLSIFLNPSIRNTQTFDEFIADVKLYYRRSFTHKIAHFIVNDLTYLLIKVDQTVCVLCLETLLHCTIQNGHVVAKKHANIYRSFRNDDYIEIAYNPALYTISDRFNLFDLSSDYQSASYFISDSTKKNVYVTVEFLNIYSVKISILDLNIPKLNLTDSTSGLDIPLWN